MGKYDNNALICYIFAFGHKLLQKSSSKINTFLKRLYLIYNSV